MPSGAAPKTDTVAVTQMQNPLASWGALIRSFRVLAAGEVGARMLGLIAIAIMTRALEPAGFGLVTLGTTLVIWFRLIVDSGTELVNLRDISRQPGRFRALAEPVLGLRLVMSVIAGALYSVAVWFVAEDSSDRTVLWLFALVLPMAAINLRWMVLGVNRSRTVATGNILAQLLFMIGVLLLVNDRHDTIGVPVLQSVAELGYAVVVLVAVGREFGALRPRVDLSAWRASLREGWPLMINQFSRALVQSFDVLLIGVVLGSTQAGLYGAAYKPILFFSVIGGLLFNAFLASYSAAPPAYAKELFRRTVRLAVLATLPIALLLSAGSHVVVTAAFGFAYAPAGGALAILAWSIVLTTVGTGYARLLVAAHEQSRLMWHNAIAALLNVAVNVAVVPLAGIEGAALVTLASELLVIVLNYRTCARLELLPSPRSMIGRAREEVVATNA